MGLPRGFIENLIYGTRDTPRFTQDSPVLPDVWFSYAEKPTEAHDLLLTPHFDSSPGEVGTYLRRRFEKENEERLEAAPERLREQVEQENKERLKAAKVAYTQTYVAARLTFDELVRFVLPETSWWQWHIMAIEKSGRRRKASKAAPLRLDELKRKPVRDRLAALLAAYEQRGDAEPLDRVAEPARGRHKKPWYERVTAEALWLMRIVGAIAWIKARDGAAPEASDGKDEAFVEPSASEMVEAIAELVADLPKPEDEDELDEWLEEHKKIWLINLNRQAHTAVDRSVLAVKADAARTLFKIRCADLAWAIVDNGVDARHPAFWRRPEKDEDDPRDDEDELIDSGYQGWEERTRVVATYDFTRIRDLLDPSQVDPDDDASLQVQVKELIGRLRASGTKEGEDRAKELEEQLRELQTRLLRGRKLDWGLLEPFLRVPHDRHYQRPDGEHGTHVAGILAADWPQEGVEGMCPDIRLYDLRVLGEGGANDEFAVLAALQFIDHLNAKKDFYAIHGVNVSLSIRHEVANFACGRTPVCDECERLVSSGVVVVAAAGNDGYLQYVTASRYGRKDETSRTEGYHTVSITDPGNADKVITVGSTHRWQPHTYGVSYFSSRGPTGDGRIKPDLVAPGEKINSPVPDADLRRKDGTSMAAPHVSGAAALLMARHDELIGRPDRIKKVLTETATDLGRERYFQGAGMLDVLRALQSV